MVTELFAEMALEQTAGATTPEERLVMVMMQLPGTFRPVAAKVPVPATATVMVAVRV
jgi:hypothetical protein